MTMNRKLILGLRRRIEVQTRQDVTPLPPAADGAWRELLTCRKCNKSAVVEHRTPDGRPIRDNELTRKLTVYRGQGSGIRGKCPTCTKRKRDELYPISPVNNEGTRS